MNVKSEKWILILFITLHFILNNNIFNLIHKNI